MEKATEIKATTSGFLSTKSENLGGNPSGGDQVIIIKELACASVLASCAIWEEAEIPWWLVVGELAAPAIVVSESVAPAIVMSELVAPAISNFIVYSIRDTILDLGSCVGEEEESVP